MKTCYPFLSLYTSKKTILDYWDILIRLLRITPNVLSTFWVDKYKLICACVKVKTVSSCWPQFNPKVKKGKLSVNYMLHNKNYMNKRKELKLYEFINKQLLNMWGVVWISEFVFKLQISFPPTEKALILKGNTIAMSKRALLMTTQSVLTHFLVHCVNKSRCVPKFIISHFSTPLSTQLTIETDIRVTRMSESKWRPNLWWHGY